MSEAIKTGALVRLKSDIDESGPLMTAGAREGQEVEVYWFNGDDLITAHIHRLALKLVKDA